MRLIDADELKNRKIVIDYDEVEDTFDDGLLFVTDLIDKSPTVDAVPVRHGRWQGVSPFVDSLECSECRYCIIDEEFITPYCPWCGAKMSNGERKGGTSDD